MRRRALVVVVAGLALTAGCQGLGPGVEPADIAVTNGSLETDPGLVFARLQRLSETNVTPPARVRAFDDRSALRNGTGTETGLPPVQAALGWRTGGFDIEGRAAGVEGFTSSLGTVVVFPGANASRSDERLLLAHELTHYIQFQQRIRTSINREIDADTTDGRYVRRALAEGGAVYTTDAYLRRYGEGRLNSPVYDRVAAAAPPGHVARYGNSRYIEGHDYVTSRVGEPSGLDRVYRNPPRTSEELLHNLSPGSEPPVELTVSVDPAANWSRVGTDRLGEAFLRYTLEVGVAPTRAREAADGWGNDRLVVYRRGPARDASFVWALAWDSAADETTAERALRTYLGARGERVDGSWRLEDGRSARLVAGGNRTTALVLGEPGFVNDTAVTAPSLRGRPSPDTSRRRSGGRRPSGSERTRGGSVRDDRR